MAGGRLQRVQRAEAIRGWWAIGRDTPVKDLSLRVRAASAARLLGVQLAGRVQSPTIAKIRVEALNVCENRQRVFHTHTFV